MRFVRDRNLRISRRVPISSAALALPAHARPGARTPAPACGSTGTPMAQAGRSDIRVQCLLQIWELTQTTASCGKTRPAPTFADEFPAVPGARRWGFQEGTLTRADYGCPSDRTFPASARNPPHRKKNFPATHPPADHRDVPLRVL